MIWEGERSSVEYCVLFLTQKFCVSSLYNTAVSHYILLKSNKHKLCHRLI